MIYLYSNEGCSRCKVQKKLYEKAGTPYIERHADRLKFPEDEIDREALIEGSMNNMLLPIIVEIEDGK
jgi:arsenate reductase-like glutaredoxin family protein